MRPSFEKVYAESAALDALASLLEVHPGEIPEDCVAGLVSLLRGVADRLDAVGEAIEKEAGHG
ncbi:hypothetical protein [Ectothiorhodospira variabilis]|uniref:hypothetical protein n=1 Tax=Ectothiorhodospira variabilis TaxID=505694 RepID=UPI001EFA7487|nr:hypothetical protein [Ectothiorhodospira variabilis]MCG5495250.1 hypothetical protein [Ectothiorhodospira variabilis]MCG5504200.1 hypothetical protein [Ectothiorhodospira variabilis]MCG5507355.1 hypothetical protein [Ectothiorhodospira variabilis]